MTADGDKGRVLGFIWAPGPAGSYGPPAGELDEMDAAAHTPTTTQEPPKPVPTWAVLLFEDHVRRHTRPCEFCEHEKWKEAKVRGR
jgi:hypothetical protein